MKIALAQTGSELGEIVVNVESHVRIAREAAQHQAALVVFPELSLTGYDVRERASELALTPESRELSAVVQASQDIDIHLGFVESNLEGRPFNSSGYISRGTVRSVHRKVYLPTYGRFREGDYFAPGNDIRAFDLTKDDSRLAGASHSGRVRIGSVICEELWHPSVPMILAQDGCEVLIVQAAGSVSNSAATTDCSDAIDRWKAVAVSAALANRAYLILTNRTAIENEYRYFGNSLAVSPRGEIIAEARAFEEDLLLVDLDLDEVARARSDMPLVTDERCELTIRELERIWHKRQADSQSHLD